MGEATSSRVDGYAPIEQYAALGDGRTVALVARDGRVDWLPAARIDSTPVFGALLDAGRGGSFALAPVGRSTVSRRYLPHSNVLETTHRAADGEARVVDGLMLQDGGQLSWVELLRKVEGVEGRLTFRYELRPRFGFECTVPAQTRRGGALVFAGGRCALAFRVWRDGKLLEGVEEAGELDVSAGETLLFSCVIALGEPIALPTYEEHETRLTRTIEAWRRWASFLHYDGPHRDAVERSALALKLLVLAQTGATAAAPTTSLPEQIGGARNWDYRFAWVRDTALGLDALGSLGFREQVHASLSWLLRATASTHPRLRPFYTLSAEEPGGCDELELSGYRGSRPVRRGNDAAQQLQLGSFGDLLETIWLYVRHGNLLDERTAVRVAELANHVCRVWTEPDSGIWELDEQRLYTESRIKCWLVLRRAGQLAAEGHVPDRDAARWAAEREHIREWIDTRCWSEREQSYTFYAGTDELDAAVLQAARCGFLEQGDERLGTTIDAIERRLSAGGPLLYRYSGCARREGAFLACSFWLVSALATAGRHDRARALFDELVPLANDVGLFAEQIDPGSGAFLGNFPQGLTHLSLLNAALAL